MWCPEELELSGREAEQVTTLVDAYMEARSRRWRQVSEGDDVHVVELEGEYEASRDPLEQDLIELSGEDGLEQRQEELRRGGAERVAPLRRTIGVRTTHLGPAAAAADCCR